MRTKFLTAFTLVVTSVTASQAGVYSLEVIPNHPTDRFTVMSSINDHGMVVGESYNGTITAGSKRIVSYRQGEGLQVVVDNLSQDGLLYLPHVNNAGQIAYTHNLRPGMFNDLVRTYRYTPGFGSEELASPNPLWSYEPLSMNEGGDILGQSTNSGGWIQNSVVWRADGSSTVIPPSYEVYSIADDRTLSGRTPTGGFVWREGRDPELQVYPGSGGWTGQRNVSGQTLGGYFGHTWLWAPDFQSHIEIPIDSGILLNDGSVIGGQRHGTPPFLGIGKWSQAGGYEVITEMLDSDALAHGFNRWIFHDVNQSGQVLATAWTDDPTIGREPQFGVLLTPVPEPGTMLALGAGLAAMLRRRRTT